MKVRFLADADLNKAIVNGVLRREPSLNFLTAHAAGLRRIDRSRSADPGGATAASARFTRCRQMSARCRSTSENSRKVESTVLACSLFLRALTWEQQSRNFCSSGSHRRHRSGETGWRGCRFETHQDTRCAANQRDRRQGALRVLKDTRQLLPSYAGLRRTPHPVV